MFVNSSEEKRKQRYDRRIQIYEYVRQKQI